MVWGHFRVFHIRVLYAPNIIVRVTLIRLVVMCYSEPKSSRRLHWPLRAIAVSNYDIWEMIPVDLSI